MNKYIIFLALSLVASVSCAEIWVSPIDIKYKDKNTELFSNLSEARVFLDNWEGVSEDLYSADKILRSILSEDVEYAPAYREYGRLLMKDGYISSNKGYREGSLSSSETHILEALKIEPEYADAYVLLGRVYKNMKQYEKAEESLRKADEIGTKSPWLDLEWASLHRKLGNHQEAYERASKVANEGTEDKNAYSKALTEVKNYYKKIGDYESAKTWYLKIIDFKPNSAWAKGNYASFLLYRYGDVDGAIRYAEEAISIMDYGIARKTLACALFTKWSNLIDSGAPDDISKLYFDRAYKLFPFPDLYQIIGTARGSEFTRSTADRLSPIYNRMSREEAILNRKSREEAGVFVD